VDFISQLTLSITVAEDVNTSEIYELHI